MRFRTAQLSDAGGREINQDACGSTSAPNGVHCWVLADGLGGHAGGEIAAQLSVSTVLESFRAEPELGPETLQRCIAAAQRAVQERQTAGDGLSEMRSTVVVLLADARQALWAHVGDSRLYHLRAGRIIGQTEDHSVPQVLVAAGDLEPDDIRQHADRNRLLRSLGQPGSVDPAVDSGPRRLQPGDAFLLCSDGFWELVHETEMEVDLAKSPDPGHWLELLTERLHPRMGPGDDNFTAIGVFLE